MTMLWGATLGAGFLLVLSPWLWPSGARPAPHSARNRVLTAALEGAGYAHLSAGHLVVVSVAAAVGAAAVAWLATGLVVVVVLSLVAGGAAPTLWLRARARRLRVQRRGLWPDVCDLLIAGVRAGMSLPDAVTSLGISGPVSLRPAFAAFGSDMAASGHFDSAILRVKSRLADPVADRIIESLRIARQVGGTELTTVLRALSASVRAETALRAEVEARQSWIRGAAVLGVVAPWVILTLLSMRPEGARAYSSAEGVVLIIVGAAVSVVAFRAMTRIGRLSEPKRWFG